MNPTVTAFRENCTCFLYDVYKLIENGRVEEGTFLNCTSNSLDAFDFHVLKCSGRNFRELKY